MMREAIFREFEIERDKQDRMWGGEAHDAHHTAHDWIAYLVKHVGKAVHWPWTVERFRHQMVIIGALSVAIIEWCDAQRTVGDRPPSV
jgi:hypothetical protein